MTGAFPGATLQRVTALHQEAVAAGTQADLTIGIAYPGDPDAAGTWSGTPASIGNAMRQLGVDVRPLRAEPPRAVEWLAAHLLTLARLPRVPGSSLRQRARISRTMALYTSREMSALRTRALSGRVRDAQPLDAIVQIGTAYGVPAGHRVATFEDVTVVQALSLPYPEWQLLSKREQEAAVRRQAKAYTDAVACCFATQWAADSAVNDYGISASKVHVVGVGRNHAPRPVPRDWSEPRFLFVGGDWAHKRGDAVVRSFARVRERVPGARLDLVGGHPRIDVEGVTGHGRLSLGDSNDRGKLDRLFEQATCFVMPSLCEGAGIVYLEAGAAGVPSIGSSVGGGAELISDGGCVVDPRDEQALLDAMFSLSDAEAAREAGARALARSDRFTWPAVASRILAALQEDRAVSTAAR